MKKMNDRECIVGPVRLSYMNVFKPRANDLKEGKKEYSVTLLIPKEATAECPAPKDELDGMKAILKGVAFEKWGNKIPPNLRNPIRDGDTETDSQGEPKAPGYWFMNVSAKEEYPPMLINGAREKVTEGWNSGDWGKVQLAFFAYDQKGNRGVSAGLRAIQFTHHGDPLGGTSVSADNFDVVATAKPSSDGAPDGYDPFADE